MSDMQKIGPGIWFVIHTLAYHATTEPLKDAYQLEINTLCDHFGCETCKTHFSQFILSHPFIKYKDNYFKWSWELHNYINKILNKSQIKYEVALQQYKNNTCQNCTAKPVNPFLVPVKNETFLQFMSR